jgi:hypothetical protein
VSHDLRQRTHLYIGTDPNLLRGNRLVMHIGLPENLQIEEIVAH